MQTQFGRSGDVVADQSDECLIDCFFVDVLEEISNTAFEVLEDGTDRLGVSHIGDVFLTKSVLLGGREERLWVRVVVIRKLVHLRLEVINCEGFQRDVGQLPCNEAGFPRQEYEVTSTFSICTASTPDAMDILICARRDADLDNTRYAGIINASGRDIRGNKDRGTRVIPSECRRCSSSSFLSPFGVNLVDVCLPSIGKTCL